MRRRRRQAASLIVLLALGGVLAAHHGGLTGGHQRGHDATTSAGHQTHAPPVPAVEADVALAVCLAVLPLLAVLGFVALGGRLPRWGLPSVRAPAEPAFVSARAQGRRSRAGPRLLCVMRC